MNRDQAHNLIKTTFTRPFDKTGFRIFTLNLLNRIDESKASGWSNQRVKDAFKDHVQHYERLGTYTSTDKEKLDVLIVHLTNESKLERARTAIRNFVADHLKTRDEKEAALVAFVSPTEKQWRFSYVKMDYATVQKESRHKDGGQAVKVGVETRLTPARRFSYLVGEGESSHTAQSRFVDLLQNTQTDPSLAQIEEAFSVEAVTKEFFKKYAELFEQIEKALSKLVGKDKAVQKEFTARQVNTIDFAKKLMGQIVFLYFIQKKGWLGVEKGKEWGTGPRDFLRRLANSQYGTYDNFFNEVLEPLFYDTLATDRGHEAWDKRFKCRIPFLNGGLFEPLGDYDWRKTDIIFPNKLFMNNDFVEEGITGTGILDVFDRYNFTVNEAEPLEKEVAIDPEMLGKVFENLIEENRRKGLGSYYTPREIVHYMCQESLINYLDTAVNVARASSSREDTKVEHASSSDNTFEFLDPFAPVEIRQRNLPHWTQPGVTYFVTFRSADSLPQEKLEQLRTERERWSKTHHEPLSNSDKQEYRRLFAQKVEEWLDAGIGSCVLREHRAAKIVAEALQHFDGKRYTLGAWVVMPNHVHVLVTPLKEWKLVDILHSWKSFTANEIHKLIGGSGQLWQHESYDHIVRNEDELARIEEYIRDNPMKAGIVAPASSAAPTSSRGSIASVAPTSSRSNIPSQSHDQDDRATLVPRSDIETFVHLGDQISHYEAVEARYAIKMPKSIEQHARLIDDKLKDITVCDPAVGSGAFPVGMMTEIVRARIALTPYFNDVHDRTPYHFKRHAIQNCLYGVDIDLGAVEIAKLRLWLSLVVDEEEVKQIKPLPNLDYKIVKGNSLLGVEKDLFNNELFDKLEKLKPLYFDEVDKEKKDRYKRQIEETIHQLTNLPAGASAKAGGKEAHQKDGGQAFDFEIYFSEVFHRKKGFDVVIGNPPYLNVELVAAAEKEHFARVYKTFYKRFDVFGLFFELGLTNLVQSGTVAFIVPQQLANNLSYKKLRDLMLNNKWLHEVLYLGDKIFESASNDVCVLFLWKPRVEKIRLVQALDFEKRTRVEVATDYFKKFNNVISFSADAVGDAIFDKLFDAKHERLRERFEVFQGIVTGNNTAFLPEDFEIRSARIEKELLYPVLHGRDFERWLVRSNERRILYLDGDTDIKAFPNAERWLSQFKHDLKQRREVENGVIPWFSLQWPRKQSLLSRKGKIAVQATRNPRLKLRVVATFDEKGIYGTQGLNFVVPKQTASAKYVLGILNSAVINYLYATKFLNVAIKAEYLKDTPIPAASSDKQKAVERLVDRILAAKARDAGADTSTLEREIDQLVYKLYGLSEEEIGIVEGKTK